MDVVVAGNQAHCAIAFTVNGVLTDPTTVTFKWQVNNGAVTSYVYPAAQVVKEGTGLYYVDLVCSVPGTYDVGFYATGTVVAADEGTFDIAASAVA